MKLKFVSFRGKSLTSKAIKFWTRSEYSHIAVQPFDDLPILIEAWPHKGGFKTWWDWSSLEQHTPGTPFEVWAIDVPIEVEKSCMNQYNKWAREKQSYDWRGIIGFVFKFVRDAKKGRFCSEGAIEPLAREMDWNRITPSHISPQNFVEIIQAAGAKIESRGTVKGEL